MKIHNIELISEGDMVVQSFKRNELFEPDSVAAWTVALSRPGAVALDVGAYTGLYSLVAKRYGATVYAFEPNPANYERLVANLAENPAYRGQALVTCAAVGDQAGKGRVWDVHGRPRLTSAGKVCADLNGNVDVITVDSLQLPRCDVIKADVEGAELAVLQGAARTIAGFLPRLILEANSEAEREALDAHLQQYGYGPGVRADVRNLIYVHPDR